MSFLNIYIQKLNSVKVVIFSTESSYKISSIGLHEETWSRNSKRVYKFAPWCFVRKSRVGTKGKASESAFLLPRTVTAVHVWGIKGYGRLMADQAAAPVPLPTVAFVCFAVKNDMLRI